MPKQIKDKITNKLTISVPSDFDEEKYEVFKTHNYIISNFRRIHQFNYGIREYIALYPTKTYENEDEFFEVCIEIQKVLIDNVKYTYKYKNHMMEKFYKFPKNQLKRCVVFIEDSD